MTNTTAEQKRNHEDILTIREFLTEKKIIHWLLGRSRRTVGYVRCFGYEHRSWIQTYILEQSGFEVTQSNLAILFDSYDCEPICGWEHTTEPPESVPSLESIALWFPEAMEWMCGDDEGESIAVTGQDVLNWIADRE